MGAGDESRAAPLAMRRSMHRRGSPGAGARPGTVRRGRRLGIAPEASECRQVRRNCVEELGKEKTAIRFSKTAFGPNNVPKYPDVPHALDRALRDGRLRYMLDE